MPINCFLRQTGDQPRPQPMSVYGSIRAAASILRQPKVTAVGNIGNDA
jgi:hypothetical protein